MKKELRNKISGLTYIELQELSEMILQVLSNSKDNLEESHIEKCKKCGGSHIVKHGKDRKGNQRYKCSSCGCTFTATSFSTISHTHGSVEQWKRYITLLISGSSLRRCSEACDISLKTAFIWRHKILNALQHDQDERKLSGIVEMDDTFFQLSFKGNHTKSKNFVMPRKSYKRGSDNRHQTSEMVCVMCAAERKGQAYGEVLGVGKVHFPMLSHAFDNRLLPETICVTDGLYTYRNYFKDKPLELIQVAAHANGKPSGPPEVKGVFHVQNINNFHQRFRKFMRQYNGVASKYLNHYVNLFVWKENHKQTELNTEMRKYLADNGMHMPARDIFARPAIPAVA